MSMHVIPTAHSTPRYQQRTTLGGVVFTLGFAWNSRDEAWYLTLGDATGDPIASGIKLVPRYRLLQKISDLRRPAGELVLDHPTRPTLDDPGELFYLDPETVNEIYG